MGLYRRIAGALPLLDPRNLLHVLRSADLRFLRHERAFLARHGVAKDEWAFIFPFGLGDIYVASAFAAAVRARHGGSGVTMFVRPQYAFIPRLFAGVTRAVPVPDQDLRNLHQHSLLRPGRLLTVFPMHAFREVIGHKGVSFLDYYRLFLQLPLDAVPEVPRPQAPPELEAGARLLERHGLPPRRSVILAPRAGSTPQAPAEFWAALAQGLLARGYAVATNLGADSETAIAGTTPLRIPAEQLIACAQGAGWVVSARSGICDLLAHASCRLSVVYPDPAANPHPQLTRGFGLVASGWRTDAREIWYDAAAPQRALAEALVDAAVDARRLSA